jgi:hypothetical protein
MSHDSRGFIGLGWREDVVKGTNARSGDDVRIKHYIRTLWYDYSTVGVVIKRERIQVKATLFINTSSS